MTRRELQNLSRLRIREALLLLNSSSFSGAYYLAGYSVECALKACIAKEMRQSNIPDKKFINEIYTHNLKDLVKSAGLEPLRAAYEKANVNFAANWAIVKDWNETSRYNTFTPIQAQELFNSITSRSGGVLPWIRQYW
jgi:hypothetical protein